MDIKTIKKYCVDYKGKSFTEIARIVKEEEVRGKILDIQKECADTYGNIIPTVEKLRENEAEITRLNTQE